MCLLPTVELAGQRKRVPHEWGNLLGAPVRGIVRRDLVTVRLSATVNTCVDAMYCERVGSVIVVDEHLYLRGIFTERDALSRARDAVLSKARVQDFMTEEVIVGCEQMTIEEALTRMLVEGIRHLPIVEGPRAVGIVSMRDLAWSLVDGLADDVRDLDAYIRGEYCT